MTQVPWSERYAQRTHRMRSSAVRELLKVTEQPEFISFGGGMPAPEVFPVKEIAEACQRVLGRQGAQALQYAPTEGYRPLREFIAQQMREDGVPATVDNVLVTTGSQQALDLLGRILIDAGDPVMVEAPTYLAALQAWNLYGAAWHEVPSDEDGLDTDALRLATAQRPKLLYCQPNFQNPAGVTLTAARRRQLAEIASEQGMVVVEDDPYRVLRFEGTHLPRVITEEAALRAPEPAYDGNMIYLSTFSKILAPGLRIGWVVAPAPVIALLALAKQSVDLHTPTFNQMVAYDLASRGILERHAPVIIETYRQRRDAMLAALEEHFPPEASWTHPQGGMFLWVTLPTGVDAGELLRDALQQKVAFVPGAAFYPSGMGANKMRLNFSNATPERIFEGIARLARAVRGRIGPTVHIPSVAPRVATV